jgi:hypothetical protein
MSLAVQMANYTEFMKIENEKKKIEKEKREQEQINLAVKRWEEDTKDATYPEVLRLIEKTASKGERELVYSCSWRAGRPDELYGITIRKTLSELLIANGFKVIDKTTAGNRTGSDPMYDHTVYNIGIVINW